MSKAGLPTGLKMRHDAHYVEQIAARSRSIGRTIPIDRLIPNPEQPRTEFGDLEELTDSIRLKGVLEPLLVRPTDDGRYMIIAGERRWRASKAAGLTVVPCIELEISDNEIAEIALIENLQRKDLNVWEEADGLAALVEKFNYTQEEIAKKISKSRTSVTELLTIAGLPEDIRKRCREMNILAKSTLLEVARQFDDAAMHKFLDDLAKGNILPKTKKPQTQKIPKENKPKSALKAGRSAESAKGPEKMPPDGQPVAVTSTGYRFDYSDKEEEFRLVITFAKGQVSRSDILRSLKEVFDAVKNEEVNL
ncbi:MAG TPA: ParB/RepB/Spo0J family partition protein [Pyrinomonadaceae bacterium]|nr:ParB/RepB/Spo0J family partition protein [Pyrinomonadaceae bacterium]